MDLSEIISIYGKLEQELQQRMSARCAGFCVQCHSSCCRIDFCLEALESPFLQKVRNRFAPSATWDPKTGYLRENGCGLAAGRPPVCHEFICRLISEGQPDEAHRRALQKLGMILTQAGKNAFGKRHLVELNNLERLNFKRLACQLAQGRSVLCRLDGFWHADGQGSDGPPAPAAPS